MIAKKDIGSDPRPIAILLGATCTGKTELAIALSERMSGRGLPLEVIGADARQIYRELSVGTAKPTPEEREAVPHHMVDVADPAETFDAARYAREARRCAEEVYARGALPLVVGGSGLYIRALVEGLFEGAGARPEVRRRLERQADREGVAAFHRRLRACDPEAAERIHPNDRRRVVRALEVFEATGRPITSLRREAKGVGFANPLYLGVRRSRKSLEERIEARVRRMFGSGMVEEALRLERRGLTDSTSFEGIGYAEALGFARGTLEREAAVERICRLHRAYAKRQRTWFRKVPGVHWLDADEGGPEAAADRAAEILYDYLRAFSGRGSLRLREDRSAAL